MNIDKLLKFVWLGCGLILLGILLVAAGVFIWNVLPGSSYVDHGVVVNSSTSTAQAKIQAEVSYGMPYDIGNSEYSFIKVFVAYKKSAAAKLSADMSSSYENEFEVNQPSNLIFLDKDLQVMRHLLQSKALIKEFRYPNDDGVYRESSGNPAETQMNFICYDIAHNDTDKDGEIDGEDESDLFVSDLDGGNLTQVTAGWNVVEFEFRHMYKTILIRYRERKDEKGQIHFASFNVAKKQMTKLVSIDEEIGDVEKILQQ